MVQNALNAMRAIVPDVDEVLNSRTLFGVYFNTDDPDDLRLALAFMMVYRDMR